MRFLFAYPFYPEPDTSAGGYRLVKIIKILRAAGHSVTLLARRANAPRYREALEAMGVCCSGYPHGSVADNVLPFRRFLEAGRFDAAILCHYHIYRGYANHLRSFLPGCHLALDTVDIHHLRERRAAELSGDRAALLAAQQTKAEELAAIRDADQVWTVTETDGEVVRSMEPAARLEIVPLIHDPYPDPPDFSARHGVIFLGGYGHPPNVDAVDYFMRDLFPLVEGLQSGLAITLAGSDPPEAFLDYPHRHPNVRVPGFVPDHRDLLLNHRVGIAPLRYGAGMKGKIAEYLACGLPCVTTSMGAEGMHLEDGVTALIADDPATFAQAVCRLHEDKNLWERLSVAGREHVARMLSSAAVAPAVLNAVKSLVSTPPRKRRTIGTKKLKSLASPSWWVGRCSDAVQAVRVGGVAELRNRVYVWLGKA
jgi:glycosyltransferase involved in cell wall biosynthesis